MHMCKCEVEGCNFDAWEAEKKCVLHCDKDYGLEADNEKLFCRFYEDFNEYVIRKQPQTTIKNIEINKVIFPNSNDENQYHFFKIIKDFHCILFIDCIFFGEEITKYMKSTTSLYYEKCMFHNKWNVYGKERIEADNKLTYKECIFENDFTYLPPKESNKIKIKGEDYYEPLFIDCEFKKNLSFKNVTFETQIFKNSNSFKGEIGSFKLDGCKIEKKSKFILNNHKIDKFELKNTEFEAKFEFKKNQVNNFYIHNTNFGEDLVVDMYETKFTKFHIEKSIFQGFVGFEKCTFSTIGYDKDDQVAKFTYATFLSFINFRNAKFYGGLDLENTNLKESPNFLNIEVNEEFSNRETFRIIKDAFDSVGNNLEGNKYFAYEMRQYRRELKKSGKCSEKFIFWLNWIISDFGQSYVQPIIGMIIAASAFYGLTLGYEYNIIYCLFDDSDINERIYEASKHINSFAKCILPLGKFLKEGMEFLSVIFYIIYVSLTWQTLVALKRHTKR